MRVVILTADVGEGHAAAARALADELRAERPDCRVFVLDALAGLGAFLRYVLRDAYRWQLRRAPWIFGLLFGLLARSAPLRALGRTGLALLGARGLLRLVSAYRPDLVVSTYPAATSVLGQLRRRGRIAVPTCATVTDLAGVEFWAHPSIDRHLVMHESSVAPVERVAGPGSVRRSRPPIARQFFEPCSRERARRELSLPPERPVVVVSGGGWGVGDLLQTVGGCLGVPEAIVVCVAGKNRDLEHELAVLHAAEPRVRILGFTDRMNDLLAAADALVHSTGGVTCLEAIARECPIVAYGAPPGHARAAARVLAEHGLATTAETPGELTAALTQIVARRSAPRPGLAPAPSAAALALGTALRLQRPARRMRVAARVAALATASLVGGWTFLSDDAYPFTSRILDLEPVARIPTAGPQVAIVVRAPQGAIEAVLPLLRRTHVRVSFGFAGPPDLRVLRALEDAGSEPLPELAPGKLTGWLRTRAELEHESRRLHVGREGFYLAPASGFTAAQHLLGRDLGARPIVGAARVGPHVARRQTRFRRGDVIVVSVGSDRAAARRELSTLLERLTVQGLHAVPVRDLASGAHGSRATARRSALAGGPERLLGPAPGPTRSPGARTSRP